MYVQCTLPSQFGVETTEFQGITQSMVMVSFYDLKKLPRGWGNISKRSHCLFLEQKYNTYKSVIGCVKMYKLIFI